MEKKVYRAIEEKQKTKQLYDETFHLEPLFSKFYYEEKCKDNLMYVVEDEGEVVSMLHLNPYTAILNCYPGHEEKNGDRTQHVVDTYYLTSAATKDSHRNQGLMESMLKDAIRDLYNAKVPFIYLRPISEEFFKPFQFRHIWNRQKYILNKELIPDEMLGKLIEGPIQIAGKGKEVLTISILTPEEYAELAEFMNHLCYENYGLFMRRDEKYVSRMQMAYPSRGGNVFTIRNQQGTLEGYFTYKLLPDGTGEIRECGIVPRYEDFQLFLADGEKEPWVMARVIHLNTLLKNIHSKKSVDICMKISDPIIEENNGTYLLRTSIFGTRIEKLTKSYYENMWEDRDGQDHPEEIETTVDKLLCYVFGYKSFEDCFTILTNVCGIEDEIRYKVKCLRPYGTGFINEMV